MSNFATTIPGICRDCGSPLPIPRHGRRIRCFECSSRQRARMPEEMKAKRGPKAKTAFDKFSADFDAGVSLDVIAQRLGVSYSTIRKAVICAGRSLKDVAGTRVTDAQKKSHQRFCLMRDAYKSGATLEQISHTHGVTRQRVQQILADGGVTVADSGRAKENAIRRAVRTADTRARRDMRCMSTYGCSYLALEALFGEGVVLTKHKAILAYVQQRMNANTRRIEFSLTFPEWWSVWQKSGRWEERGRGKYVMARNGDVGPYAVGNVHICTSSENVKEGYIKTPAYVRAAKAKANPNKKTLLGSGKGWTHSGRANKPYRAQVGSKYLGEFETIEEARAVYLAACEELRKQAAQVLMEAA